MNAGEPATIRSMNPMKKTTAVFCLFAAAALLAGCESARKAFGTTHSGPDEFAVYSRPPLSLPPDYKLRPPTPGVRRPQGFSAKNMAEKAMLRNTVKTARGRRPVKGSVGIQALLRDTGGIDATPNIRDIINQETSIYSVEDQRFVDKLIFWVDDKPFLGTVVDAEKERKRIQEAQALGKPINEGKTPEIKRKPSRKGLLDF